MNSLLWKLAFVAMMLAFAGIMLYYERQAKRGQEDTSNMIGSRIRVHNTDGSSHCEEIYAWVEGKRVAMKFCDFSPPVQSLAIHFLEEWDFATLGKVTLVTRTFSLFPKSRLTRPVLWFISFFLKRAIDRQLVEMAQAATNSQESN